MYCKINSFLRLCLLNFLTLTLVGCTPENLFSISVVGHTILTEPRSIQNITLDAVITHQIEKKLSHDTQFMTDTHVIVTSYNRVVLLTGQVPYKFLRDRAEAYAKNQIEVRRVFNQIKIKEPNLLKLKMQDSLLVIWIRFKLLFTSGLRSNHFKVVVEDKNVFLIGKAKKEEANLAALVLRNTKGIRQVVQVVEPN